MTLPRTAALEILMQLKALLEAVGDEYCHVPKDGSSTMGRHVRHILDEFSELRIGCDNGRINYNRRSRDSNIEISAATAFREIEEFTQWLDQDALEDCEVQVECEVSLSQERSMVTHSSLHREICYVIHHTIHYIAIIRLIAMQMGITMDDTFGIGPATATHLRRG